MSRHCTGSRAPYKINKTKVLSFNEFDSIIRQLYCSSILKFHSFNPLLATLTPQSNGPMIGILGGRDYFSDTKRLKSTFR